MTSNPTTETAPPPYLAEGSIDHASSSAPKPKRARLTINDFPPVTTQHILNCSYGAWYERHRNILPKAKVIPLSQGFIDYLNEDGIVLPEEDGAPASRDDDSAMFSSATGTEDDSEDEYEDPSYRFTAEHEAVRATIREFKAVTPKLNWSLPKDAAFIIGNSTRCSSASDVYLLLKSSSFITHDLDSAFDGCVESKKADGSAITAKDIPWVLVLRKWINVMPSVEFRVFVRGKKIIAASQRDMNYYDFLAPQRDELFGMIEDFFEKHLRTTFPDDDFVFDVYIPKTPTTPSRVWLIDINPYAPRTDPLTFSWTELLNIDSEDEDFEPEMRLVNKDDPEAYNFQSNQYSAHKLPKEVVAAGNAGPNAIAEFASRWREIVESEERIDAGEDTDESDEEDEKVLQKEKKADDGKGGAKA